jgi:hypothetical protein
MDKVKLGRALGYGARHAMKTVASAVDAATSPDPNAPRRANQATQAHATQVHEGPVRSEQILAAQRSVAQAVDGYRQVHAAKQAVKKQAIAHVKRSFWAPLKSFSSVLWLQVTGSFFALFALTMGSAIARHRNYFSLPMTSEDGRKIYFYLLAFSVFGYFTVSNFVRANRRSRR